MDTVKIKETFDYLYLNESYLTSGQASFVDGLKTHFRRNKELSEKQSSHFLRFANI
jgi:hypothetical protein